MKHVITLLALLGFKGVAVAQEYGSYEQPRLERGAYYALSPKLAHALGIDYQRLIEALRPRPDQGVVVKKNVETNAVDISIFDSNQFAEARMDFVKQ